jgi:hypothetical protein
MPWWMIIYLAIFALIVTANSMHWILVRQKVLLTLYGFAAGAYLIFMIIAYWCGPLKSLLTPVNIGALITIIVVDIYFSVMRKNVRIREIFPNIDPEREEIAEQFSVLEIAKASSILIAAPGYIVGAMLAYDLLRHSIH